MPAPKHRSRSKRRVFVRTPGSKTTLHYRRKLNAKPKCGECGQILPGVARGNKTEIKKLPKTKRRPDRPFGGVLCSRCSRKKIIEENR